MIERGFFKGKSVDAAQQDGQVELQAAARTLWDVFQETTLSPEHREDGKSAWLMFDVDGIFVEHKHTAAMLDAYITEHQTIVDELRARLALAQEQGFHIGLSTGRNLEFTRALAAKLFANVQPDAMIVESGLLISQGGKELFPSSIRPEDAQELVDHKPHIERFFQNAGWRPYNLHHCIGLVWPENVNRDMAYAAVIAHLSDLNLEDHFIVVPAPSSIDIFPRGGGKEAALRDVIGDNSRMVYFGDSSGDHGSMQEATVIFTPQNAARRTKEFAVESTTDISSETTHTFHMRRNLLEGTTDAMRVITDTVAFLQTQREQPTE